MGVKFALVSGRCNNSHGHRPAFGSFTDIDEAETVRLAIELLPIRDHLGVVGKRVVVADVEAEMSLWSRDGGLSEDGKREEEEQDESPNSPPQPRRGGRD